MKNTNSQLLTHLKNKFAGTLTVLLKPLMLLIAILFLAAGCSDDALEPQSEISDPGSFKFKPKKRFVGAVYAMTNGNGQGNDPTNAIVAYGRNQDGTLSLIGTTPTFGKGGDFDGGEGLDPLISAYAITKTADNKFVLAVNAGSNTITALAVKKNFGLFPVSEARTGAVGPNSIAVHRVKSNFRGVNSLVYVSNITRAEFADQGEPAQQGTVTGYWLLNNGKLLPIAGSTRNLGNRPSAVQFSPDGKFLAVTSINAGSSALGSGSQDEVVVYKVGADGRLSAYPTGAATSTLRDNAEGRNLPSAIGFQIVGDNYLVVTEAREFQPDGTPPAFTALQSGSVSTWQIGVDGSLTPINLDVPSGNRATESGRTACWLDFNKNENAFFVSNAIEAGLASYSFDNGQITLIDELAAEGNGAGTTTDPAEAFSNTDGWIDLWVSDDGKHLYQLHGFGGAVSVFEINGSELSFVETVSGNLPEKQYPRHCGFLVRFCSKEIVY